MITGSAKARMDDKGRLAIPNRYREALSARAEGEGLVLTLHPHNHLTLYEQETFERVRADILGLPNIGYMEAHLQEVVIGCAEPVGLDSAGRILVQNNLRERAGIEREVLLFGVGDSIHLWDEKAWEKRNLLLMSRLQDGGISEQWQALKL